MTLEQFITSCRVVIGDRSMCDVAVLEIVEDCLKEDLNNESNLVDMSDRFKNTYKEWIKNYGG